MKTPDNNFQEPASPVVAHEQIAVAETRESPWVGKHISVGLTVERDKEGNIVGFASSAPGRKRIFIPYGHGMEEINPDMVYEVEVTDDTNPDDQTKGKLTGRFVGTRALTKNEWGVVESEVNTAEALHRSASTLMRDAPNLEARLKEGTAPKLVEIIKSRIENNRQQAEERTADINEIFSEGPYAQSARALVGLRTKNVQEAFYGKTSEGGEREKSLRSLLNDQVKLEQLSRDLVVEIRAIEKSGTQTSLREDFEEVEEKVEQTGRAIKELINSNPETYTVAHLLDLRRYKREMLNQNRKIVEDPSGKEKTAKEKLKEKIKIVETPSVKEKIDEMLKLIDEGQPIFLHGMPGSGKTECAIHLSLKYLGKEPTLIYGNSEAHTSEFLGSRALTMKEISESERDSFVSGVTGKFNEWKEKEEGRLQTLGEQARQAEEDRMWTLFTKSFEATHQSGTITKFLQGPVYDAMREGRPFIIDEANLLPEEVLLSLNHLLTRRPGDKIVVNEMEDKNEREFEVQPGFCFILTGNIGERFLKRKEIDSSTLRRVKMVQYDYTPQRVDGDLETERGADNELFQFLLVDLMGKQGDIKIPHGAEKDLWRLAQATRQIQDVYSGKSDFKYTSQGNESLSALDKRLIEKNSISFSKLMPIISAWKADNFKFPIERYVLSHLIDEIHESKEKAVFYQIFYAKGFFQNKEAYQVKYGREEGGIPSSFEVVVDETKLPKKNPEEHFTPRETVELAYGPAPLRTEYPGGLVKEEALGGAVQESSEVGSEQNNQVEMAATLARLRDAGYLDILFEGKETHRLVVKSLTKEEAIERYKTSGGKTKVWDEYVDKMPYKPPQSEKLDVMIMNFNKNITSDEATAEMDTLGVRPLTYEELIQYGIAHPEHQKQKILMGLGSKSTLGDLGEPRLDVDKNGVRMLSAGGWGTWGDGFRFPVVSK